jgi:beta-lactam-binding protein with PASTA domain
VPRVIGLTLSKAKAKIQKAHCVVGKIRRARSTRPGRVIGQSPRPGVRKPNGFKVKLVVGRR